MKLKLQACLAIGALAILLVAPASAMADAVTYWNGVAVQATVTAGRPGPTGVLDIAVVQAAVYDAVQAIEKRFKPYHMEIPGATGSSAAAAAKAAHDVLVNRFPAQTASLDALYSQFLVDNGLAVNDPGVNVGAIAAAGIIASRATDGSFPVPAPPPFIGGTDPGVWRPTLPAFAPMIAPWLGSVTPFTLTSSSQFRAQAPPALTSAEYTRDYNEAKEMGALNSTARLPEQTDLAQFWAANYPVVFNALLRNIASAHVNNIADSSRLFALADMAIADAVITSWDSKSSFVAWRPITAIREGNNDGNPQTDADPTWLPLVATPAYPDHTSGANNVAASATRALSLFFGTDEMSFQITTTNTGPTLQDTRSFNRFSDVAEEVVVARIWEGIHFRFADEAARKQGKHVAQWAFGHFFKPLDDD